MKTWIGLVLLATASLMGVLPLLPASPARGGFTGEVRLPAEATVAALAVSVWLLRRGR